LIKGGEYSLNIENITLQLGNPTISGFTFITFWKWWWY